MWRWASAIIEGTKHLAARLTGTAHQTVTPAEQPTVQPSQQPKTTLQPPPHPVQPLYDAMLSEPAPKQATQLVMPKSAPPPFSRPGLAQNDRVAMQRNAVRAVRTKLEQFLASLEGLDDETLIRTIHQFERYGYSKVTGVPRIDIPLRRDHYDHDHLQEMKAFIEAKCAILLRICDREELLLELKHPSNLIGVAIDEVKPATRAELEEMASDLTKEIDHMTRILTQNIDPRLLGS